MFWKKCNVVKKFRVCSTLHSKTNVVLINLWLFLQAYMISNTYSHGQKRWNPDSRITTVAISLFDHNCIFLALLVSWFNKWGRRVLVPKHTVIHIASLEISWESWPLDGICSIIKHSTSNHTRKCTILSSNLARKGKSSTFMSTSV